MTCEPHARQKIDALLAAAGWVIQDREASNRNAALGVAIADVGEEFAVKRTRDGLIALFL